MKKLKAELCPGVALIERLHQDNDANDKTDQGCQNHDDARDDKRHLW